MLDLLTRCLTEVRYQTELLEAFDWDEDRMNEALTTMSDKLNSFDLDSGDKLIPYLKDSMLKLGYSDHEIKHLISLLALSVSEAGTET